LAPPRFRLFEAVALAVHFENVDVMGQTIEQGAGQALIAEAFMLPSFLTV
jgi:hypothetical protein